MGKKAKREAKKENKVAKKMKKEKKETAPTTASIPAPRPATTRYYNTVETAVRAVVKSDVLEDVKFNKAEKASQLGKGFLALANKASNEVREEQVNKSSKKKTLANKTNIKVADAVNNLDSIAHRQRG